MSILIKGMDKPTDCGLCPFEDFGYCSVKGERNTSESGIDADCPLIEVADRKTEPTGYNLSPVDKDINVRSKDEPQTETPRCSVNGTPFDECGFCEYFNCDTCKCEADEPQTEREGE